MIKKIIDNDFFPPLAAIAVVVAIISCVVYFAFLICPKEFPEPHFKFDTGQVVKFIINGQKGQVISTFYYRSQGLPLYNIRTSQKSGQTKLNGGLFYGASGGTSTPTGLCVIEDVHEYEIVKI